MFWRTGAGPGVWIHDASRLPTPAPRGSEHGPSSSVSGMRADSSAPQGGLRWLIFQLRSVRRAIASSSSGQRPSRVALEADAAPCPRSSPPRIASKPWLDAPAPPASAFMGRVAGLCGPDAPRGRGRHVALEACRWCSSTPGPAATMSPPQSTRPTAGTAARHPRSPRISPPRSVTRACHLALGQDQAGIGKRPEDQTSGRGPWKCHSRKDGIGLDGVQTLWFLRGARRRALPRRRRLAGLGQLAGHRSRAARPAGPAPPTRAGGPGVLTAIPGVDTGFHGTIKPPFHLAAGTDAQAPRHLSPARSAPRARPW